MRGRATARGEVAEAVDAEEVRAAVEDLERRGVEALTVSLLNGYAGLRSSRTPPRSPATR